MSLLNGGKHSARLARSVEGPHFPVPAKSLPQASPFRNTIGRHVVIVPCSLSSLANLRLSQRVDPSPALQSDNEVTHLVPALAIFLLLYLQFFSYP